MHCKRMLPDVLHALVQPIPSYLPRTESHNPNISSTNHNLFDAFHASVTFCRAFPWYLRDPCMIVHPLSFMMLLCLVSFLFSLYCTFIHSFDWLAATITIYRNLFLILTSSCFISHSCSFYLRPKCVINHACWQVPYCCVTHAHGWNPLTLLLMLHIDTLTCHSE